MARIATVRLRRKSDGREITVSQIDYAADPAAWKDWKIVGDTHGEVPPATANTGQSDPENIDWLNLPWPQLRSQVGKLKGVDPAPKNKDEALAVLREWELIPAK